MKKTIWSWILIACLLLMIPGISCAVTYTLPEKLSRQLEIGSGLKGTFTLSAEGNAPWIPAIAPFAEAEVQVRGIASGDDWHYYLYQADEAENQWARSDFYLKDGTLYLRSDLLPGNEVYFLPPLDEALDQLTNPKDGNPSFASVAYHFAMLPSSLREEAWNPLLIRLEEELESWLTAYASEPYVRKLESGSSVMDLNYVIPADALRNHIVQLAEQLFGEDGFRSLASELMTDAQKELYLNPYLGYYYREAMQRLKLDFDISYSRTVSTMGETLSSQIELPLDEETTGFTALTLHNEDGRTTVTLRNSQQTLILAFYPDQDLKRDGKMTCFMALLPEEDAKEGQSARSLRLDFVYQHEESTDEEERSHETDVYQLRMETDTSFLPEEFQTISLPESAPVAAEAKLHYYSKYAQSSPTTLEVEAHLESSDAQISLQGKFKSASPWVFAPFDGTEKAISLLSLAEDDRLSLLSALTVNAQEQLQRTDVHGEQN